MVHMKNRQVLEDIRGYAAARRVRVTSHGRRRMSERGVTYDDLRYGLMNATECEQAEQGRWKVDSIDRSGDRLTVVILFWDGLLVVTVF
jgi:hypothetical protein